MTHAAVGYSSACTLFEIFYSVPEGEWFTAYTTNHKHARVVQAEISAQRNKWRMLSYGADPKDIKTIQKYTQLLDGTWKEEDGGCMCHQWL